MLVSILIVLVVGAVLAYLAHTYIPGPPGVVVAAVVILLVALWTLRRLGVV